MKQIKKYEENTTQQNEFTFSVNKRVSTKKEIASNSIPLCCVDHKDKVCELAVGSIYGIVDEETVYIEVLAGPRDVCNEL